MILSIIVTSAVIAFLYYYVIHIAKYRRLINLIPGPPQIPVIGEVYSIFGIKREEIIDELSNRVKKYGPIQKSWFFLLCGISLSHPDDIQVILSNTAYNTKGVLYEYIRSWMQNGLLLSKGAKWQERRKILTPAFHFDILKGFFDIVIEEATRMVHIIKHMDDSTVQDLGSFIGYHTLNIISETAMGVTLRNIGEAEEKQYRETVKNMGDVLVNRFFNAWMFFDVLYKMTPTYREQVKCLKILHGFTEKVIAERKQYHKDINNQNLTFGNSAESDEQIRGQKKRLAFLDILLHASTENNLSDLDIREEVDTFMFAGHDTTGTTLTYAILLLAENTKAQDRVRNEINAVMKENGGKLTATALQNLTYLEQCLKESMRLYPSAFFMTRKLEKDAQLRKYLVPAGAEIHIDVYNLHRNPEFWPNPEMYDPDRFLPELVQKRNPFAYIPFSAGSRNCIGQRFAMMELKAVIGTLIHNFYLEPIDHMADVKFNVDLLLHSLHPLRVKFIPL